MAHQIDGVFGHLLGQFAGGAQNQSAWIGRFDMAGVGGIFTSWFFGGFLAIGHSLGHFVSPGFVLGLFCLLLLLQQGVHHGQQKRCGFTAARLTGNQQIVGGFVGVVLQGQRDGANLYRRGLGKRQVTQSGQQFGGKSHVDKARTINSHGFRWGNCCCN